MEQYRISQQPTGGGNKPVKHKNKVKAAPRKQTKSLSPQLILVAVAIIAALLLSGAVFARYMAGKGNTPVAAPGVIAKERAKETGEVSQATFNGVTDAIGRKQVSGLNGYYANKVRVRILKNNINKTVDAKQVASLINGSINDAETPWNWNVPPGDLSAWQQGPHGEEFIGNVIVGVSPDGTVIVIHIDENGDIDEIFIAPIGDLTNPTTPTTPTTPTDNPSQPTNPTPEKPVTPVSPSGDNTAD